VATLPSAVDLGGVQVRPAVNLGLLLALVTSVQALATFAVLALPTLATKAAPAYGFGAWAVGYQIGVVYCAAAIVSSAAGLYVCRYGAVAASVAALLLGGAGLAALASGDVAVAIAGSLLIGAAYGLTNPAASHLLFRFAPRERQNLIFALKQTGVPLGGILAAAMLPQISTRAGWQVAILAGAVLPVALASVMWIAGRKLDDDRDPSARLAGGLGAGMRMVLGRPSLRAMMVMGTSYAILQFCLFAFLVTMLVEELGWSIVAAGGMATVMQIAGVAGRIGWSLLADRTGRPRAILVAIGVLSALSALVLSQVGAAWSASAVAALVAVFGFSIVGWNGLWMAEIARMAGPGEVGLATGGVLVFTYAGVVVGPAAFATTYKLVGSWGMSYAIFAGLAVLGAVWLAAAGGSRHGHSRAG
jgi:predicted MFS family arabinose efflux permease